LISEIIHGLVRKDILQLRPSKRQQLAAMINAEEGGGEEKGMLME
jgi:hypothetical protein